MDTPAALMFKDSTYGYHNRPIIQGVYSMGIPAALLYKNSILWVSQQPYCTCAVSYGYPSSHTVQGQ